MTVRQGRARWSRGLIPTTSGILENDAVLGSVYAIGTALLQVTRPRRPLPQRRFGKIVCGDADRRPEHGTETQIPTGITAGRGFGLGKLLSYQGVEPGTPTIRVVVLPVTGEDHSQRLTESCEGFPVAAEGSLGLGRIRTTRDHRP